MKTAKELFEELGYELCIDPTCEWEICFKNSDCGHFICFENKKVYAFMYEWNDFVERYDFDTKEITMQELQAINKMVEELNW